MYEFGSADRHVGSGRHLSTVYSDVNNARGYKAKSRHTKAKAKAKNLGLKAKAKA